MKQSKQLEKFRELTDKRDKALWRADADYRSKVVSLNEQRRAYRDENEARCAKIEAGFFKEVQKLRRKKK